MPEPLAPRLVQTLTHEESIVDSLVTTLRQNQVYVILE
jgi:hypothetical protein